MKMRLTTALVVAVLVLATRSQGHPPAPDDGGAPPPPPPEDTAVLDTDDDSDDEPSNGDSVTIKGQDDKDDPMLNKGDGSHNAPSRNQPSGDTDDPMLNKKDGSHVSKDGGDWIPDPNSIEADPMLNKADGSHANPDPNSNDPNLVESKDLETPVLDSSYDSDPHTSAYGANDDVNDNDGAHYNPIVEPHGDKEVIHSAQARFVAMQQALDATNKTTPDWPKFGQFFSTGAVLATYQLQATSGRAKAVAFFKDVYDKVKKGAKDENKFVIITNFHIHFAGKLKSGQAWARGDYSFETVSPKGDTFHIDGGRWNEFYDTAKDSAWQEKKTTDVPKIYQATKLVMHSDYGKLDLENLAEARGHMDWQDDEPKMVKYDEDGNVSKEDL